MIINLTQHCATPEQIAQGLADVADRAKLQTLLTIAEDSLMASDDALDVVLSGKVRGLLSEFVLPEQVRRLREVAKSLTEKTSTVDVINSNRTANAVRVLVGGAPILMERLIPALKSIGAIPLHALSVRASEDQPQSDGSIRKASVFRHLRFRKAV